jgi:gliding motility-associated-like protein
MTAIRKWRGETKKKHGTIRSKVLVLRKISSFRRMVFQRVNLLLTVCLSTFAGWSQPANDGCNQAIPLCPNVTVSSGNQDATRTFCPSCEDDFTFCFTGNNSVWFTFETNSAGGSVSIDFTNVNVLLQVNHGTQIQATIIEATVPCNANSYTAVGNCQSGTNTNFSLTANGLAPLTTYYVVVNGALNGFALPAEATFDITATGTAVDRLPAGLSITGPGGTICPEVATTFNANVSNCTDTTDFYWYLNGTLTAVTSEALWQTSEIQDGDIVTLDCSCFTDCPQSLNAQFGPIAVENLFVNAGADQLISAGQSALLSGTTNGTTYNWTPPGTLASPTSLQTIAIPTVTTTYFLTASSANCSLSDDVVVTVSDQFTIPGSFSPNGDGTNDSWVIEGIDFYPNARVTIFDRWGQEIFDAVGYNTTKSWDGTQDGKEVTDGVYYYIVDLRDAKYNQPFKGFVSVIR